MWNSMIALVWTSFSQISCELLWTFLLSFCLYPLGSNKPVCNSIEKLNQLLLDNNILLKRARCYLWYCLSITCPWTPCLRIANNGLDVVWWFKYLRLAQISWMKGSYVTTVLCSCCRVTISALFVTFTCLEYLPVVIVKNVQECSLM